jgi:hypothetical protein
MQWFRDRKDDARSQEADAEYEGLVGPIAGEGRLSDTRPATDNSSAGRLARTASAAAGARRFATKSWRDELGDIR